MLYTPLFVWVVEVAPLVEDDPDAADVGVDAPDPVGQVHTLL
jgi:hypothetical protein